MSDVDVVVCDYCRQSWPIELGATEPLGLTRFCEHGPVKPPRIFADVGRIQRQDDGRVLVILEWATGNGPELQQACLLVSKNDAERLRFNFGKATSTMVSRWEPRD